MSRKANGCQSGETRAGAEATRHLAGTHYTPYYMHCDAIVSFHVVSGFDRTVLGIALFFPPLLIVLKNLNDSQT